jgi:hypothetical protein
MNYNYVNADNILKWYSQIINKINCFLTLWVDILL